MRVRVIEAFPSRSGVVPVGRFLEISESTFQLLAGKVAVLTPFMPENSIKTPINDVPELPPTHCKAVKTDGRICGAPLKTGLNGWMSCSDMSCQVPAPNQNRK